MDNMVVHGHIQNGTVVAEGVLSLPDGTKVTITVCPASPRDGETMSTDKRSRYLAAFAQIDAVANENPGDSFSGSDHDQALYGDCG